MDPYWFATCFGLNLLEYELDFCILSWGLLKMRGFMGPPYHNTKAAHDSWSLVMLLTEMVHYVMAFHSVVLS